MQNKRGFTLIEILVVMLIIGITIGFAVLAFGDFGAKRQLHIYTEHFESYLSLLQQRAILENITIGLHIDDHGYTPYSYQYPGTWQPFPKQRLFVRQVLPRNIELKVSEPIHNSSKTPAIILHPSGDMEPFRLQFKLVRSQEQIELVGTHDGKLKTGVQDTQP
ncbi:MAG: type II secretion system minor pseudopilin GspH [Legionellaceae bacterium]|nr:type II secretion system minor pseudopilin GspH [Legionellaceae bacterium]